MRNVVKLDLGDGVVREIEFINSLAMTGKQVMIELYNDRPLSQIAADFEGREKMTRKDDIRPDVETVYSGFTRLTAIQRSGATGSVRITLEKP